MKAEATKPLKLYVSRLMKGWTTAAYLDAPTDAEKAEAPGEKVFAVYRGVGAAAGTGKALVIHRAVFIYISATDRHPNVSSIFRSSLHCFSSSCTLASSKAGTYRFDCFFTS